MALPAPTKSALLILGTALLAAAPSAFALSLSEAYARALEHDPAQAELLASYDIAREAGRQENGTLLPSVSLNGNGDWGRTKSDGVFGNTDEEYPTWGASLEARQPLFRLDWGARRNRAKAQDALAEAGLAEQKQALLLRVSERYFAVLLAQDELRQAEAEARSVRESFDDTQKRYDVELVPGTDLKEAQASDDLAQARLLSARRGLETARDTLEETTGAGREPLPDLPEAIVFPPLQPSDPAAWVQSARSNSPALKTAQQNLEVARANVRSRKSDAAPALDAVASAGRNDTSEFSFGSVQDDARIGVQLTVPIYAGGINGSRIREAEARTRSAEAQLQRTTLETERSTRTLYRDVETAYIEVGAYDKALASATAAEAATRYGYDAGTRTITDVLEARSRVVQARRDANQTRYNLLSNLIKLKQSAGVLTEADFVEIDRLLK